ncbi:MAG: arginyltransferase [Alphaproteobacteria bacterium]
MTQQSSRLPRFFFRTSPQPCPYLPGRVERNIFAELGSPEGAAVYGVLVRHGFRRSHRIVYRPDCPGCNACTPVRVVVPEFSASESQRRVVRRNADLFVSERPPVATEEQYRLFRRYVEARHGEGEMSTMDYEDFRGMIEDTPVPSMVVEFRDPAGALQGTCLIDRLEDGLSAVYSFFEPTLGSASLGTFMVLWLIERVRREGQRYAYLGYWIESSRKMSYKARFQPLEALGTDGWARLAV